MSLKPSELSFAARPHTASVLARDYSLQLDSLRLLSHSFSATPISLRSSAGPLSSRHRNTRPAWGGSHATPVVANHAEGLQFLLIRAPRTKPTGVTTKTAPCGNSEVWPIGGKLRTCLYRDCFTLAISPLFVLRCQSGSGCVLEVSKLEFLSLDRRGEAQTLHGHRIL